MVPGNPRAVVLPGQLPPRATVVSDKKAAAEREDVKRGRAIRERHDRAERLGGGDAGDGA